MPSWCEAHFCRYGVKAYLETNELEDLTVVELTLPGSSPRFDFEAVRTEHRWANAWVWRVRIGKITHLTDRDGMVALLPTDIEARDEDGVLRRYDLRHLVGRLHRTAWRDDEALEWWPAPRPSC